MTLQHTEWIVIRGIQSQVAVLGIALQPALPLQVTTDPMRYLMHHLRQFCAGGFIDPIESGACPLGANDVDTIQEQHVKMDVEIERSVR
jgi:hypothetical protein